MKKILIPICLIGFAITCLAQPSFRFTYKIGCHEDILDFVEGEERVDALIQMSAFEISRSENIRKGIELLLEARDISIETGYGNGLVNSLEKLGDIYHRTGNYSTALHYYRRKYVLLEGKDREDDLVSSLMKMADVSVSAKEFDSTINYVYESLEILKKTDDSSQLPRAYYFLALAYRGKFDYETALKYTYLSLEAAELEQDNFFIGHCYNAIGDLNEMKGEYRTAFESYKRSEKIFEEFNISSGMSVVYFNIGSMHKVFGDYDKALEYMSKSLELSLDYKNTFMIRESYLGLYGLYNLLKDFGKANEYYMLLNSFSTEQENMYVPLSKIEIDYEISKKETEKEILRLKVETEKNMRYIYAAVFTFLLTIVYFIFYRKLKQKRINELRLEERRVRAELSSLQFKINPHFLFNSLSSITELINFDPESAKKMLQNISNLLRYTLRTSKNDFVKLEEEILMVEKYLEIEKIRFGKRLEFEIDIPENLRNMLIPPLLIQPLVENSIKHGLSNRLEGGMVKISAYENIPGRVQITVEDNGVSKDGPGKPEGTGIGLSSVKERLDLVYKNNNTFAIEKENGFIVKIGIPKKI